MTVRVGRQPRGTRAACTSLRGGLSQGISAQLSTKKGPPSALCGVPEPCACLWQMQLSSLPRLRPRPVTGRGTRNQGWLRPGGFCLVPEGSHWAGLGLDSGLEPLGWSAGLLGAVALGIW